MTSQVAFAGEAVLKRCCDPIYLDWIRRERSVLEALAETRLRVPRLLGFAEVERDGGKEVWLAMTRLPGGSLWLEMLRPDSKRRAELLGRLGAALRELHATPVPQRLMAQAPWLDRILARARRNLSWCDGSPELLASLEILQPRASARGFRNIAGQQGKTGMATEPLIHGDLALDNVLIDANGAISFIDWSGGDCGDPRCDVSLALQTEPEIVLGQTELRAFFEAYGEPPLAPHIRKWFQDLYEFF